MYGLCKDTLDLIVGYSDSKTILLLRAVCKSWHELSFELVGGDFCYCYHKRYPMISSPYTNNYSECIRLMMKKDLSSIGILNHYYRPGASILRDAIIPTLLVAVRCEAVSIVADVFNTLSITTGSTEDYIKIVSQICSEMKSTSILKETIEKNNSILLKALLAHINQGLRCQDRALYCYEIAIGCGNAEAVILTDKHIYGLEMMKRTSITSILYSVAISDNICIVDVVMNLLTETRIKNELKSLVMKHSSSDVLEYISSF